MAGLLATVLLAGSLATYAAVMLRDLPDPANASVLTQSIVVFDRNGKEIAERNPQGQYHVVLKLAEMGRLGPAATLAAEDRGFYSHGAVDPGALARAAATDVLSGRPVEGGSTITQQLVKIQLLQPQRSIVRKGEEAYLAWVLEHRYRKDQILEMYLNRVYYGHGAYGLGAAVKTYFGSAKEARDLTPAQAAFLAGLLQAPAGDDPQTNWPGARARQLYVLKGMVATHALSQSEADQAAQEDVRSELRYDTSFRRSLAPHFVDYVIRRLEQEFGSAAIQQGGISVYTTLDAGLQRLAEQSVADGVKRLAGYGVNNGDLLAVRPATGEILAWVGSADYGDRGIGGEFDVVQSPRQPGSSFKPYVYEAALRDHKISLCTVLHDTPTSFAGYRPLDFDNSYLGSVSARRALLLSRNIPAVETANLEGMGNVDALAARMGIRGHLDTTLPTAIGASEVTMFDHVQGYQVFADQGQKMPLMGITKVVGGSGGTIFEQRPGEQKGQQRVLSPAEAYLITDVLKDYPRQWRLGWNRPMAGKSGTTGGSQSGVHPDAWMMAYSPDVVVGAWGGNTGPNGAGHPMAAFGVNVGSTISAEFINGLPRDYSHWFSHPPGLVQGRGGELLLPGTDPQQAACRPSGPSPAGEGGGQGEEGEDHGGQVIAQPGEKKKH